MNNTPPPKEKKPLNDGIEINPFNQFRRRLPALMGGSSQATGWDASPAPPLGPQLDGDKDEKEEEVEETKVRFKKLAYGSKESTGGSGGGGGIIIIAGIIVALFIFA